MDKKLTAREKIISQLLPKGWDKKKQSYAAWIESEQFNIFWKFDASPKTKELLQKSAIDFSSVSRTPLYKNILFSDRLNPTGTICTVCKIKKKKSHVDVIYGFVFSEIVKITKAVEKKNKKLNRSDDPSEMTVGSIVHKRFTTGPSLVSSDGEFRNNFVTMAALRKCINFDSPVFELWEDIYKFISDKIINEDLVLTSSSFYPTKEVQGDEATLEHSLSATRLKGRLFAAAWFNDMFNAHENLTENHINEKYKVVMFDIIKDDMKFFTSLIKKHTMDKIMYMHGALMQFNYNTQTKFQSVFGQKIIPLNLSEIENPFNIRYKPWREYLIARRMSSLVLNNVACGFPLLVNFIYIKNTHKGLFDNDAQYGKMEKSEMVKDVAALLVKANNLTSKIIEESEIEKKIKDERKLIKSTLINKFKTLGHKIKAPIDYSSEEIIMSNVALCMFSEYVGRTFFDALLLSKKSPYYNSLVGDFFKKSNFPLFEKYIFELCYNLLCMNKHGVIHGDLHLNNVTLRPKYSKSYRDIGIIDNPKELFVVGEDEYQYLLPTVSYNTSVIDFSRSIVHIDQISEFEDPRLPKILFPIVENIDAFNLEQINKLSYLYVQLIPDMSKHRDEVFMCIKNKYDASFKLLTVMDIYKFTSSLIILFNAKESSTELPKINPLMIELVRKINRSAEIHLVTGMNKLMRDGEHESHVNQMELPMLSIIKQVFTHLLVDQNSTGTIVDVFIANREIKYNTDKFEDIPEYLTAIKYFKEEITYKPGHPVFKSKHEPLSIGEFVKKSKADFDKKRKKFAESIKVISYIAKRHREKLPTIL